MTAPLVEAVGVRKSFGRTEVLSGVTLDVAPGEVLSIVGPSGSGKSTFLRCINVLETYQAGRLRVGGELIGYAERDGVLRPLPNAQIVRQRRRVGMVFQQFNLFPHLSVLQNCTLGPMKSRNLSKSEAEKLAMEYLERVRIPEQAGKYPAQLSGGQQQRVAIARSLCMQPKVMLFDEPTSALDPEMIKEVLDVMIDLAQSGMTMICVTHEMGFAKTVADTMVFMDHGRIVESAPPGEFFTNPHHERTLLFLDQILSH
jgi:ABC-type polar amino acid transport system ATPase subunit